MPLNIFLIQGSLDDPVVQVFDGECDLPFPSSEIRSVVTPDFFNSAAGTNEAPQGLDKGIRLQGTDIFNVDGPRRKTHKDAPIDPLGTPTSLDIKGTKDCLLYTSPSPRDA